MSAFSFSAVMSAVSDLLWPEVCHLCDTRLIGEERFVCSVCEAALQRTLYHTLPLNPMEEKLAGGPPFARATGHFFYSHGGSIATLIQDFKYRMFPTLAEYMGVLIARELMPTGFFSGIDVLQPVSMSLWKEGRRGYNQAEMLARGISAETGIPIADNLRVRGYHGSQTRLSGRDREKNMKDYFHVIHPEEIEGKHLCLIDDVCTTGATLRNSAAPLAQVPGLTLSYLTLAST